VSGAGGEVVGYSPGEVRDYLEAALRPVVASGQVAWAMLRLVLAERGTGVHCDAARAGCGGLRGDALPRLAAETACAVIDSAAGGRVLPVYLAAVHTATTCPTTDPAAAVASPDGAACGGVGDLAGLALADLASLHLRLGYPGDCRRLVELAEADPAGLSGPVRAVLAMVRAWAGEYEKRHHHINHDRRREQR
jgi:hypothetical protein